MKAVQYAEYGPPEVLTVGEVEEPHAGPGQVRVATRAVSVNPMDTKLRSGMMREIMPVELPAVPGIDLSGVVDEVGDGVTGTSAGDEVFGFATGGGAAEYAVLDAWEPKPADMPWEEAAGLPVAVETATRVLDLLGVSQGSTLLINGAAGGVGVAAVQLARHRGATVIGTASEANHEYLRSLGAIPTTYGEGIVERVRALAPDGVNLAFDTAGRGETAALVELVPQPSDVVTIADFGAASLGVRVTSGQEGRAMHGLAEAARLHDQGAFRLPVAATYPFSQAAAAHRESERGHVRGKLVLLPD